MRTLVAINLVLLGFSYLGARINYDHELREMKKGKFVRPTRFSSNLLCPLIVGSATIWIEYFLYRPLT